MNKLEEILTILSEECGEVVVEVSKHKRFGDSTYKGKTALDRLQLELGDVLCMIDLLYQEGYLDPDIMIEQAKTKKKKLEKWSTIFDENRT